jgi:hypothetical protein
MAGDIVAETRMQKCLPYTSHVSANEPAGIFITFLAIIQPTVVNMSLVHFNADNAKLSFHLAEISANNDSNLDT